VRDGQCPLQAKGVEYCGLCGLAHFSISRTCPHLSSEIQLRVMLDSLRTSKEPEPIRQALDDALRRELANRFLRKKNTRIVPNTAV
jgi:hypothetical protein